MRFQHILVALAVALTTFALSGREVSAQTGTITGVVWNDENTNGIRDDGEPGLAGWQVYWINLSSSATTTANDGSFSFTNVPPGYYTSVCLTLQPGWVAVGSIPAPGTGVHYCTDLVHAEFTFAEGSVVQVDFGVTQANVAVTSLMSCPALVRLGRPFECSLTLQNDSDIPIDNVYLASSRVLCFRPEPCVVNPNALQYVSSSPRWSGTNPQYGDPYWDPAIPGPLASSESVTVRIELEALDLDPEHGQMLCGTGGGYPAFGDFVAQFPVAARATVDNFDIRCADITIVAFGGDVNCDGRASSIDALLLLQYVAGLVAALECHDNADANADGSVDALDATLVLQFDAGLLEALPP